MTSPSPLRCCILLPLLLLSLLLLVTTPIVAPAVKQQPPPLDPAEFAHLPYQYFHADSVGGANAACWLSRQPLPPLDGVRCTFAETISQTDGRQIWKCEGDKRTFCEGCHALEKRLVDPKDLVQWKVQGC